MRNEFEIRRFTNTYADTLLALGLAESLHRLGLSDVTVQGSQSHYTVKVEQSVDDMSEHEFVALFDTIRAPKEADEGQDRDYEVLKAAKEVFFKLPKEARKNGNYPEGFVPPTSDYSLMSSLVDLLKPLAKSSYSSTAKILREGQFGLFLETALRALSEYGENPLNATDWLKLQLGKKKIKTHSSTVMIFNPMSGKGMNSDKPNSIGMGGLDSPIFLEMLKYSGWWLGAVAATPRDSKDLKVLVVSPTTIQHGDLSRVMNKFRGKMYSYGAVQIDIMAALGLTETLLEYHAEQEVLFGNPKQVIDGFHTAYFQSLGTSKGTTNISLINLPNWVYVLDDADCQEWLALIREQKNIISRLVEKESDQRNLLVTYRDFLSGNDLEQFLEFLVDYGAFALARMARDKYITLFQTKFIDRVIDGWRKGMNQEKRYSEILENQGFKNLATAIRHSTFGALNAQKRHGNRTFEVRFGLAQDLKRHTNNAAALLQSLSDFVSQYMTENLRATYRNKHLRQFVSTDDLQELVYLIDKFDAQTVGMLLIAYGYAKDEKDKSSAPATMPDSDEFDEFNDQDDTDNSEESGDDDE